MSRQNLTTRIAKRIRQFIRAVFSRMEPEDHETVKNYLDPGEKRLFYGMDPAVQKHCVNAAGTVQLLSARIPEIDCQKLIKAALLHDIGKTRGNLNLLSRAGYVLVNTISPGLAARFAQKGPVTGLPGWRNTFYIHLYHDEIGAAMAEDAGLDEDLVFLLRNHHNKDLAAVSKELSLLLEADELN